MIRLVALLLALALGIGTASAEPRRFAIIVGIDDYRGSGSHLTNLAYAESDARRLAEYFGSQGYAVRLLLHSTGNATRGHILDAVDAVAAVIGDGDSFVFSFSGHGTVEEVEGIRIGYLEAAGPSGAASRLSAGDIQAIMVRLDAARHQLFIFASCYGGLLGQLPRRSEDILFDSSAFLRRDLQSRRGRHFLSAGGADQQVLDGGPAGLSWFTYFLLKGLEPAIVSSRADGLITIGELATFVQAWAANPYHTPSFGTLAGDAGGQLLLRTSNHGSPRLPPLPNISERTLADLGFLARGEAETVRATMVDMRGPIDRLYRSWETLDIDLYLQQFDRSVVQTGRFRDGRTFSRGYDEIEANRRQLFPRLHNVTVRNYEISFQGLEDNIATFGVVYNMDFTFRDRRVIREHGIKECYKVRQHPGGDWKIIRNDDYQQRICAG
jgi:hypothetical protein